MLRAGEQWAHRTLLNTGTFVGTVGPVFKDPAVASAVAARATDELFTELNLQARLRDALPPKASFAAVASQAFYSSGRQPFLVPGDGSARGAAGRR